MEIHWIRRREGGEIAPLDGRRVRELHLTLGFNHLEYETGHVNHVTRVLWLFLRPTHRRFQASTKFSPGLLGIPRVYVINKSAVSSWAFSPIVWSLWGSLLGRVL